MPLLMRYSLTTWHYFTIYVLLTVDKCFSIRAGPARLKVSIYLSLCEFVIGIGCVFTLALLRKARYALSASPPLELTRSITDVFIHLFINDLFINVFINK